MPEIACYRRETAGDVVTVTYATRAPLMSLWRGVMIVTDATGTTEHQSRLTRRHRAPYRPSQPHRRGQMPGPMLGDPPVIERAL